MNRLLALSVALALGPMLAGGTRAAEVTRGADRAVRSGGVNTAPSMRPWRYHGANPDGWWCPAGACSDVANGTVFVDRELPLAAALGARTLRVEFPWALIEPQRGRFDWRRADYIVRAANRARVPLQPVLVYSPSWAASTESSPPKAVDFARFARALARRYRTRVRHYELWNEPDLVRYWDGTVEAYVKNILRPGYRAVKSVDRRARVILGAPSKARRDWLEGVFWFGGGRSFDIAAYHAYASGSAVLAEARTVREVLEAHGQGRKPIWLGEYGFPETGPAVPQQEALIRRVLTGAAPLAAAQWYSLRDTLTLTCCPPQTIDASAWGLLTKAYERKGSFFVMQKLLVRR